MSQTLTLDDVIFHTKTGTLLKYTANYTDIIIPDTLAGQPVRIIGESAFCECQLTRVIIPDSVVEIGARAFELNCDLAEVKLSNSFETIDYSAFNFNALTQITIPASVKRIKEYAFHVEQSEPGDIAVTLLNPNTIVEFSAFYTE